MPETQTENLVASARLAESVDVASLATQLDNVHYNPTKLDALVLQPDGATVLVFPDGTAKATGPRDNESLLAVLESVRAELAAAGTKVKSSLDVATENVVASLDLGQDLRLHEVTLAIDEGDVAFDPESFPGIVVRAPDGGGTVLCFASGRLVVTDVADPDRADATLRWFEAMLRGKGILGSDD